MKLYKRRNKWQVEFEHDGQRKRLAVGLPASASEEDATKAATERMRKFFTDETRGGKPVPGERITTMAEALNRAYLTHWRHCKSAHNITPSINKILAQVGYWMMADLSYNKLLGVQEQWRACHKPATVNRNMGFLRVAYKLARKLDKSISEVEFPRDLKANNERDRFVSDEEETTILEYLGRHIASEKAFGETDDWVQIMDLYLILVDTGARLGEIAGDARRPKITIANVHGTSGKRRLVLRSGTTKNDKPREIPLTGRAEEAILRWVTYPQQPQYWYQYRWDMVRHACNLPDVNLHILRHTCATRLLKKHVSIYTVSKWLGHSSVTVTERYAHVIPDMLDDALARLTRKESDFN